MSATAHKLAFLTSHVIQYQGPLFREIARNPQIDLTVLFCSKKGLEEYKDVEFGRAIRWDRDLLSGYKHKFLKNYSHISKQPNFFEFINLGLYAELKSEKYDALIIFGYGWFISWFAWFCCYLLKIPIIFRGETNLLRLNKEEGLKRFIKEKLLRIFFSKCAAFLPIGKLNKIYYEYFGVPSEKMFLCPYAVDNDFFIRQKQALVPIKDDLRRQYGIPVDKTAILFIGKFLSKKRPTDLLNAFKHMKNNSICSLVFVGDGPLKEELIMSVRERDLSDVHFMGFMNQSDIGKIYGICDIFVFPSDFEPYGLVLNEAMCFGLPVVVSDEISAGYDLVDGNGFVYPAGNVAKLAEYLDRLAENKILRERMGKKSSDIISRWNYDRDVKAIHAALEYVSK